jgi:hypothetical protein
VSSTSITVSRRTPASLTLTATGGTVNWDIAASAGLTVRPASSGTAQPGRITVTVNADNTFLAGGGGTLIIEPGGIVVTVTPAGGGDN